VIEQVYVGQKVSDLFFTAWKW